MDLVMVDRFAGSIWKYKVKVIACEHTEFAIIGLFRQSPNLTQSHIYVISISPSYVVLISFKLLNH